MVKISVIVITHNEEKNIGQCLESVRWADEIVLVDSFSTDRTVDIASEIGAVVFQEKWKGYARQKNSALEKASGTWILSLDADERVTPELRHEILEILSGKITGKNAIKGYHISRKNFFRGRWVRYGGWYPDYTLRLFLKSKGSFRQRQVHESVEIEGKTGYLKNPIEHYTYMSVADYLKRLEVYSRLASLEISPRKKWTRWHTLTFRPVFTAFKMYVLRKGLLDGTTGLFLAFSYAYYTFLKYYRYYEGDTAT
jgi:glycosyltransferase involved in cell wall biosynthesis